MRKGFFIYLTTIFSLALLGCSKVPDYVISPETMENLLIDIHKAEIYIENNRNIVYNKERKDSIKNFVFAKHNVTGADFDTSMIWYGANLEVYIKIYDNVVTRLQEEDNSLVALMNNQKDAYTGLTRSGDTVNIWNRDKHFVFEGKLNNNLLTFSVPYDDNFKDGDIFKLKFKILSTEKGLYNTEIILASKEDKDSTRYVKKSINHLGWDSVELKTEKSIKRVMGSFYVPDVPEWKTTYIDSISLLRIHTTK